MSLNPYDIDFDNEEFSGLARLFPLPGTVLFPHVMQPLHIFEPRYQELMEDALDSDKLITMASIQPGVVAAQPHPPLDPIACVGRVVTHVQLPDGRYNLLLLGLRRVRVIRELAPERAFRQAEVCLLHDLYPPDGDESRADLQSRLLEIFCRWTSMSRDEVIEELFNREEKQGMLGALTDMIAYSLDFDHDIKQKFLAEVNVDRRARMLLEEFQQREQAPLWEPPDQSPRKFPPDFSLN